MNRTCRLGSHIVTGLRLACLKKRAAVRQRRQQSPELQALLKKYQVLHTEDPLTLVWQWLEVRTAVVPQQ